MRHYYLSPCVDDCVVCITENHPDKVTNTKCRIDTVISPVDGHRVARNM
jgi:DNA gyrase inhibitor GyrI